MRRGVLERAFHDAEASCGASTLAETRLGFGIHAGEAETDPVGLSVHREYKVIGDVANVAARIETLCKDAGACLLVSDAVWARPGGEVAGEALGPLPLTGRRAPVEVYRIA